MRVYWYLGVSKITRYSCKKNGGIWYKIRYSFKNFATSPLYAKYQKIKNSCKILQALKKCGEGEELIWYKNYQLLISKNGGHLIQNSPDTHAKFYLIALYAKNQELMQNFTSSQKMWKWRGAFATKFTNTNAKFCYLSMQKIRNSCKNLEAVKKTGGGHLIQNSAGTHAIFY